LTKQHTRKLIPTSEEPNMLIPFVFIKETIENTFWKKICKLRINIFALIHGFYLFTKLKTNFPIQIVTQLKSSTSKIYQGFQRTFYNFSRTLVILNNKEKAEEDITEITELLEKQPSVEKNIRNQD